MNVSGPSFWNDLLRFGRVGDDVDGDGGRTTTLEGIAGGAQHSASSNRSLHRPPLYFGNEACRTGRRFLVLLLLAPVLMLLALTSSERSLLNLSKEVPDGEKLERRNEAWDLALSLFTINRLLFWSYFRQ